MARAFCGRSVRQSIPEVSLAGPHLVVRDPPLALHASPSLLLLIVTAIVIPSPLSQPYALHNTRRRCGAELGRLHRRCAGNKGIPWSCSDTCTCTCTCTCYGEHYHNNFTLCAQREHFSDVHKVIGLVVLCQSLGQVLLGILADRVSSHTHTHTHTHALTRSL
jgi:hypothetical protein